jgi:anti-sigma factor RsiW
MRCGWVQERLMLYLAGELRTQETARLLRHLDGCAACAAQVEALAETQERVEVAVRTDIEAPDRLVARVMESVRTLPAPRRSWRVLFPRWEWRPRLALASGALCLLLIGFAAGRWHPRSSAATLDLASLAQVHAAEQQAAGFRTSDPQQLSRALASQVDFPVPVVDLKPEGAPLLGGTQSRVQGVPVALLHYNWQGERISLFVMDDRKLSPPALPQVASISADSYLAGKRDGLTYVAWRSGRTNCILVARTVPMHLLFRLACHACEKQESL